MASGLRYCNAIQLVGNHPPQKMALSVGGGSGPHLIPGSLGHRESTCQNANLIESYGSRFSVFILHYGPAPSASKNCFFPWGNPEPHLQHGYMGPSDPTCQMASRSVQPFLVTNVSNRHKQTDKSCHNRCSNSPHLCCAYDAA